MDHTCQWLFRSNEYFLWIVQKDIEKNNGIIWIKGHLGSSKIILMKVAVQYARQPGKCSCSIVLEFYFNARGSAIERSPLGLFRSLLCQLLSEIRPFPEDLLSYFQAKEANRQQWKWELEDVKRSFFDLLKRCKYKNIKILIDAKDECDEDEDDVRDMVDSIKDAAESARARDVSLGICLSSRHYPGIRLSKCLELFMEDHDGDDVRRFVETRLSSIHQLGLPEDALVDLQEAIIKQSRGVFLWVFLVVRKVISHW